MSDAYNPYRTPEASAVGQNTMAQSDGVSPGSVEELRKTKPWVTFLGILGFIFSGIMVLAGVIFATGFGGAMPMDLAGIEMILAGFYLLFGTIGFFLSLHLVRFGSAIGRLKITNSIADLELALKRQRSFWVFAGILTLITLVFYAILIAVAAGSVN